MTVVGRERLERYQVLIYLAALLAGGGIGLIIPGLAVWLERMVWPVLAVLLYTTFCQVRPAESLRAFRYRRFFISSLVANFVIVPVVVWSLSWLLPLEPAIRLGFFMVLLMPCTDWFVTFSYLGRGDVRLAIAIVPVTLLVEFTLLPLYLWAFVGREFTQAISAGPFLQALAGLIVIPFILAALTRHWAGHHQPGLRWLSATTWLPIPLLALTLFLIAASQVTAVSGVLSSLGRVALVFVAYLLVAGFLARLLGAIFRLKSEASRTLAFNMGTRNSFVVLPFALALPASWEAAVAVIVLQSIVELGGMVLYLWWVPSHLFPVGGERQ